MNNFFRVKRTVGSSTPCVRSSRLISEICDVVKFQFVTVNKLLLTIKLCVQIFLFNVDKMFNVVLFKVVAANISRCNTRNMA